ncbi:MAG: hypothetical protein IPM24_11375 [Bryobacterales bacterium]|nr:hypothetical protein [Bryobacterales bacterium]
MRFSEAMDSMRKRASGGSSFNSFFTWGVAEALVLPVWLNNRLIRDRALLTTTRSQAVAIQVRRAEVADQIINREDLGP